ncbi:hypothetical protein BJX63DRAFT_25701 [Aspergillus granulosus]|uniref:Uncharacterized protein n=1 Tax=Aspergillus granulosus TaxID=176169 RepID=A0ABR4H1C0_9EURO
MTEGLRKGESVDSCDIYCSRSEGEKRRSARAGPGYERFIYPGRGGRGGVGGSKVLRRWVQNFNDGGLALANLGQRAHGAKRTPEGEDREQGTEARGARVRGQGERESRGTENVPFLRVMKGREQEDRTTDGRGSWVWEQLDVDPVWFSWGSSVLP